MLSVTNHSMYSSSVIIWTTGATSVSLVLCPLIFCLIVSISSSSNQCLSAICLLWSHKFYIPSLLSFPPASRSHAFSFYNTFSLAYFVGSIPIILCSPPLCRCPLLFSSLAPRLQCSYSFSSCDTHVSPINASSLVAVCIRFVGNHLSSIKIELLFILWLGVFL